MKVGKLTTIAVMAIAAVGITAGTAHAAPAPAGFENSDGGVGYRTEVSGQAVTTIVDAGAFTLTRAGSAVSLTNDAGAVVAEIPLVFDVAGQQVSVAPAIDAAGRSLTLTPSVSPASATVLQDVSAQDRFLYELNRASFGIGVAAAIGAGIGLVTGCIIGIVVGCIPGVLIGAAIGAVVGAVNTGGQPLLDAGYQYLTGQP